MLIDGHEVSYDAERAVRHLDSLSPKERLTVLHLWCSGCGMMQPWHPDSDNPHGLACQCDNDE